MVRSRGALLAPLATALTLASCGRGDGPALYPVHGKVIYNGQPAAGATVVFQREDAPSSPANAPPLVPIGQADEHGNFSLAIDQVGEGAPAGKYKVLIHWMALAEATAKPQAIPAKGRRRTVRDKPDITPDRLEGRYMNAEGPRFHAEVKPEVNQLDTFDVSK
jgi:hypothetical protein